MLQIAADPDLKKKLLSGRRIELAEELSEYITIMLRSVSFSNYS